MALKFSISGLRGIVGKDLNPAVIYRYARDFGRFVNAGSIVIGRDTRQSGKIFRQAVIEGLNAADCPVIDLGIVPTPTVLFMVRRLKAGGGIVITASHNPIEWNALKFVSSQGLFLDERQFARFAARLAPDDNASCDKRQRVRVRRSGLREHIGAIVSKVKPVDVRLRVAVDAVAGAGSIGLPRVLEAMGCQVFRLNCRFAPVFPRGPVPTARNITALRRFVKEHKLDIGFACDPDCDRLAVVDERGRAIGEENTLVLAADHVLGLERGSVVTNLSTTALVDFVARRHRVRLFRTKVGEANVVSKMRSVSAVIGGEGNGGVIYPAVNFTRDALVAAALIVKLVAKRGMKMSQIMASYPRYYMLKTKLSISRERFEAKKQMIIEEFPGKTDHTDGLKITGDGWWLHIRPSQTEHVVRLIGEAGDKTQIKDFINRAKKILSHK
ncbi:phosphoglucosamine mutase [candidate division WOR-3 bacterium]|nr:phosphoglucosamine mutase [candidate division WOR-3 bacterium]